MKIIEYLCMKAVENLISSTPDAALEKFTNNIWKEDTLDKCPLCGCLLVGDCCENVSCVYNDMEKYSNERNAAILNQQLTLEILELEKELEGKVDNVKPLSNLLESNTLEFSNSEVLGALEDLMGSAKFYSIWSAKMRVVTKGLILMVNLFL